ncbi:hypothetical protein DPV73_10085 [Leptospira mayottensis]|nr:hypothetical protein DPV73_10085 [Leptospira mayottensis]
MLCRTHIKIETNVSDLKEIVPEPTSIPNKNSRNVKSLNKAFLYPSQTFKIGNRIWKQIYADRSLK